MIIGICGSLSIVYCTIGLWALERFGRVKPLIISAAGLGAALVCNAAMSQTLNPNNGNMLRAMVAMNFVFSLFYTPLGIISWVYPGMSLKTTPKQATLRMLLLLSLQKNMLVTVVKLRFFPSKFALSEMRLRRLRTGCSTLSLLSSVLRH